VARGVCLTTNTCYLLAVVHRKSTFRGEIFVHRRHNNYSTIKTSLPPRCNTTQPTHCFHTRDEASTFCLASTLTELQSTAGRRQMAHHSNHGSTEYKARSHNKLRLHILEITSVWQYGVCFHVVM